MMKHLSEEEISAWVDRQLDPGETNRIGSHIRDCGECRAAAEEMAAMAEAFRSTETSALPPYLWSRIAAHLDDTASPRRQGLRSLLLLITARPAWVRLAAAALVVIVLAAGGAMFIEDRSAADFEKRALAEMQVAQNSLAALDVETYNPFRTTGAAFGEGNPFSRGQFRPDVNPFRSAPADR